MRARNATMMVMFPAHLKSGCFERWTRRLEREPLLACLLDGARELATAKRV
jgi:hypothetical protein